jgi:hypothetical protein
MASELECLQAQLEELSRELGEVRTRLERLEGRAAATDAPSPVASRAASGSAAPDATADAEVAKLPTRSIALVGRTLVVLGGAYLFRAISDAGLVPAQAGALVALLYAAWWLVQADRSAGAGQRLSSAFHGIAAALVAYPLIWETTTRFQLFSPTAASVALVAFLALGLAVARRRELWEIAWVVVLFNLVAAVALMVGTHDFLPLSVSLLASAAAVELLAMRDQWLNLRWPAAMGIDLAGAMIVSASLRPESAPEGHPPLPTLAVTAVVLAIPAIYLVSIGARTLLRKKQLSVFGMVQAAAALLVGFGGAVRLISHQGMNPTAIGVVSLLLGAGCYAAAFTSIDRHLGRGRNFYSYTTFAGLLILVGSALVLGGTVLTLVWSALAVAAVVAGGMFDRITLKFHGAVYGVAAAAAAGLLACAADGLIGDPTESWRPITSLCIGVAMAAAACYGVLVATRRPVGSPWYEFLPQAILAALVVWSAAGMLAGWLSRPAIAAPGEGADAAFVAASRTGMIALVAVLLAWAGRRWSLQELLWLVYPVLVAGGFKLAWQDLQFDKPLALFVALASYGGALIVTPRLMRRAAN